VDDGGRVNGVIVRSKPFISLPFASDMS